ncbi:hypothetical protein NQ314_010623 [Rhamnusium bicolor]|uniref:Uncharacterized protein n=1 Tax=Rhamnusium bicolor TaxID=1586634 RepID=A0AAV8XQ61_9CUCU|nr:hypothetical protein NQ314_010623 [Rhamnusium bicolor]
MPRTYRNKTDRIRKCPEKINVAVNRLLKDGLKIRRVADELGFSLALCVSAKACKKAKALAEDEQSKYHFVANPNSRIVFNNDQE